MKRLLTLAFVLGGLGAPATALAQDTNPVIFAVYYECDQNREAFTDQLQENVFGPKLDARVESGDLLAWGWLSHRIGGDWRRAQYTIAPDRETLLRVRNEMIEEAQGDAELQQASTVSNDICPDHEDYIWSVVAASDPQTIGQARPAAGMSTYYVCDMGQESRADEIVQESLAPIINRHVGPNAFNSWGWLAHDVGGEFRRLLTIDAADEATLYAHRDAMIADIQSGAAEAGAEFNGICNYHVDYQWDITISHP